MRTSRRKLEEIAWALGFHSVGLRLYRATKARAISKRIQGLERFFSSLLKEGDLVFDIGANRGFYAEALESSGATVVAVEPNPDCVRHIQLACHARRIEVIQAAVGRRSGLAQIRISDEHDSMSTLSPSWQEAMLLHHENWSGYWNRSLTVPVLTVDDLRERYGEPYYVKIDVEGSEEEVLAGLSAQPQVLSFEFNTGRKDAALACIDRPLFRNGCEFNFFWGDESDSPHFELGQWQSAKQLKELLYGMDARERNGDIFARRIGSGSGELRPLILASG